jgi:hypothetical protein
MKTTHVTSALTLGLALLVSMPALADHNKHNKHDKHHKYDKHYRSYDNNYYRGSPFAPHAGQVDTDGILSRGEIKNPLINYSRVERRAAYYGDPRFNNPYNRAAASDARYWNERERQEREWRERYDTRSRNSSIWNWW